MEKNIKLVLFDCMETVIDVKKAPDLLHYYSSLAYEGCRYEDKWCDIYDFSREYVKACKALKNQKKKNEEYPLCDRFRWMVEDRFPCESDSIKEEIVKNLSDNFWHNYKKNCYVDNEVRKLLKELQHRYRLGIVSNFMIDNGVEELLESHSLDSYFDLVITSIKVGWRKPEKVIYERALEKAKMAFNEVAFVGDDYLCDYETPGVLGFYSILLDKNNCYKQIKSRVRSLSELERILL